MKHLTKLLATGLIALAAQGTQAQTVNAWNLSRDMMNSSTQGPVWYFMSQDMSQDLNAKGGSYTLMNQYQSSCRNDVSTQCWLNTLYNTLYIGVIKPTTTAPTPYNLPRGAIHLHPDDTQRAVIGWKAPRAGTFLFSGMIASLNQCGWYPDGLVWALKTSTQTLRAPSQVTAMREITFTQSVTLNAGDMAYLSIDKNQSYSCDGATVDLIVTTSN